MWLPLMAGAVIAGTVTLSDAAGAVHPAPGVRLTLTCAMTPASRVVVSDESGTFRFTDVQPDACSIVTELQGFGPVTAAALLQPGETASVTLQLDAAPMRSGLTVTGSASMAGHRKRCARTCAPGTLSSVR
jgi:hypothetical protein